LLRTETPTHTPSQHSRALYFDADLQIIFGVTLIGVMGVTSIAPAFPRMVRELGIPPGSVGLLISVFTLPGVILTPITGVLADRYGRKRILIPSLFLFGVTGTLCWFAHDFRHLLMLRLAQGSCAASLGALNTTLIGDIYAGRKRTAAMGYNASVLNIGTTSYPAIGGVLAVIGWNYPFLLSLLAIPVGLLVMTSLESPEPRSDQGLREYLLGVWWQVRKGRAVALLSISLLTFICLYGAYLTYFPLLVGTSFHASPLVIGTFMSLMSLTTALTSSQIGRLTRHFSEEALLRAAYGLYGLGLLMIPFIHTLWLFAVPAVVFGIGHGINTPTITTLLLEMALVANRGAFMAANGTVLRLGQTLGPLVMAATAAVWGIAATFFAGVGIALAMLGIVVLMPDRS